MEALIAAFGMLTIGLVLAYLTHKARSNAHQNQVLRNNQKYYLREIDRLNQILNSNGKEQTQESKAETE